LDPFTWLEMTSSGRSFIGVIPGESVTEDGLEYFIELENSGVLATDPPDTSQGNFFSLAVEAPDCLTTQPQPTSGMDYLAGRSIPVLVALAEGVVFVQGDLFYRRGGEMDYLSVPVQEADPLPVAVIPDDVVGPRGVEYWVEVQTSTSTLTDPCLDPDLAPHLIPVRVPNLAEPRTSPAHVYRMVSVPLDFGVDFTGTLEALLSDQDAFGPYDPLRWRSFRWRSAEVRYLELADENAEVFRPVPGRAFWLVCANENRLDTAPVTGNSVATAGSYEITLEPGYNQIGDPFAFPVAWDSLLVEGLTMAEAEADTYVSGPVEWRNDGYVGDVAVLEPFAGYWVKNMRAQDIVLSVPPLEALPDAVKHEEGTEADPALVWGLGVTATCGDIRVGGSWVGVQQDAADGWDIQDRPAPPPYPDRSLSLYFPHEDWARASGPYAVDVRGVDSADEGGGHMWSFDVAKSYADEGAGDRVLLEFTGLANVPPDLEILLIDRELLRNVNLRAQGTYSFYQGHRGFITDEADTRFQLLVGSADFIAEYTDDLPDQPARTALYQNHPNPFNPSTVIRYDIAQAGNASLRIYDISGALVKTLLTEHHAPGRYEIVWRGEDEHGQRVASGVYFIQLESSTGHRQTRKTLLMK
jgi:hypothetical protein